MNNEDKILLLLRRRYTLSVLEVYENLSVEYTEIDSIINRMFRNHLLVTNETIIDPNLYLTYDGFKRSKEILVSSLGGYS